MTSKVKGILFSLILIVIALLMLPIAVDATQGAMSDRITDSFPTATVAGTEAEVVLTEDLWQDNVAFVLSLTADGPGAVPVADSYVTATNTLTITGLGATTPQAITVTYEYVSNQTLTGFNAIVGLIPLLIVVGLLIVAVFNGLWSLKKD